MVTPISPLGQTFDHQHFPSLSRVHSTLHSDIPMATSSPSTMSFSSIFGAPQMDTTVNSILQSYVAKQLPPYPAVTRRRLDLESRRPHWLRECIAEAMGVFFFVFAGLASIATFIIRYDKDKDTASTFGSISQVGWGMGMGVAFAIITCAPTSGGHFNPAITLCLALWNHFPWRKVPRYILSQIIGAFVAALAIVSVYWEQIQILAAARTEAGLPLTGVHSPAAILCPFPYPEQSLGFLFLIEFAADAFIAMVIWAALDPANPFITQSAIPFVIGIAYADMIWGFGGATLSTNLARDLGPRLVATILFGSDAFTHRGYVAIGMLVNIPATMVGTAVYELVLRDSLMIVGKGHAKVKGGNPTLYLHLRKTKMVDEEQGIKA